MKRVAVAVVLLAILGVAACGSDESSPLTSSPRVVVVDEAGRPVRGAVVHVTSPEPQPSDGARILATTDAHGVARLEGVDVASSYLLVVGHRDYAPTNRPNWEPRESRVVLRLFSVLSGVVKDEIGRPIPDARIEFIRDGIGTSVDLDEKGHFTFECESGRWLVRAYLSGTHERYARADEREVEIDGRAEVELVLDLEPKLRLRIENWPDGVTGSCQVHPSGREHYAREAAVSGGGHVVLPALCAEATYTAWVHLPELGLYLLERALAPGEQVHSLRLQRGGSISGRVVDAPRGAREVSVVAWSLAYKDGPGIHARAIADKDGGFALKGLPNNPWRLSAVATVGSTHWSGPKAAIPVVPTDDVVLSFSLSR